MNRYANDTVLEGPRVLQGKELGPPACLVETPCGILFWGLCAFAGEYGRRTNWKP